MKDLFKLIILLTIFVMLVSACVPAETPAPEQPAAPAEPAATEAQQPSTGPAEVIKVGALYPLTGADAGWAGDPYIKSHQMAIDEINAAGGIKCLDGAKLELVKGDTQGKAEAGNSEMERLITREGVVAVMGSALSGTTLPASEISEKYEIPYIVPNALDGMITDRGMKYVFQTVSTLQQWGADDAKWAKDHGAKTAVITTPNFTFGAEVEDTWKKGIVFKSRKGKSVVRGGSVFIGRNDLKSEVTHMAILKAVDWGNFMYWACWMLATGCLIYLGAVVFGPFVTG